MHRDEVYSAYLVLTDRGRVCLPERHCQAGNFLCRVACRLDHHLDKAVQY